MVAAINIAIFQLIDGSTAAVSHFCENFISQASRSTPDLTRGGIIPFTDGTGSLIELSLDSDALIHTRTDARPDRSPPLTTIYAINRMESGTRSLSYNFELLKYSLFPSLKTYKVSITGSVLKEELMESIPFKSVSAKA